MNAMLLKLGLFGVIAIGAAQGAATHLPDHFVLICEGTRRNFDTLTESKVESSRWEVDLARGLLTPGRDIRPYKITSVNDTTIEAEGIFTTDTIEIGHIMAASGEAVVTEFASDAIYAQTQNRCRPADSPS